MPLTPDEELLLDGEQLLITKKFIENTQVDPRLFSVSNFGLNWQVILADDDYLFFITAKHGSTQVETKIERRPVPKSKRKTE